MTEQKPRGEVPSDGTPVTRASESPHWQSDEEIDSDVERIHKSLTKKIVIPLMGVISIAFYASGFQNTTYHIIIVIIGLVIAALNAWISNKTDECHFQTGWRTDTWDATRWLLSVVVFDLYLMYAFRPPLTVTYSAWTILIIAAQSDLFQKQLRNAVVLICWAAGGVGITIWYPDEMLGTRIFAILSMALTCLLFERLESYWCSELVRRRKVERIQDHALERLLYSERDAQIGAQVRTISHELGNLINILQIGNSQSQPIDREVLTRTLSFITKINGLILRDIDKRVPEHAIQVQDVMADIMLLIRPEVITMPCRFHITASPEVRTLRIKERTGSLFLIIHNLVKNGMHAISAAGLKLNQGSISIRMERHDKELRIAIEDNGIGMDEKTLEQLLSGQSRSINRGRHGLGFAFVLDECRRNKITLSAASRPHPNHHPGTVMTLTIPIVSSSPQPPPKTQPAEVTT